MQVGQAYEQFTYLNVFAKVSTYLGQIWRFDSLDDWRVVEDRLSRLLRDVAGPLEIRDDLRGLVAAQKRRDVKDLNGNEVLLVKVLRVEQSLSKVCQGLRGANQC